MNIACQLGFEVKHLVPHVHTQNDPAEAFIKRLQMIAQSISHTYQVPDLCLGPCNIASNHVAA